MVGISKRVGNRKMTIGISEMPFRKKLCLVVEEGMTRTKYATFNNEEAAYAFMDAFCDFMGVERVDWFGRVDDGKDD